ncbi:cytochrome P450 [Mycobacterium paraffinicum]|uniref:Cytochrome P450 Cyp130 n=1 Tax=Mycobacterium paraffinicum TaxID=53378 RepID=A0ABP8F4A7_9MYCO|nr:cytochrome P450 [Mycobacterium paraffinicum]MCV7313557.1 cytochrome P450 [Mycobacterium paraffinicum]
MFDPYDPAVQENPYPIYRQLRREAPVYWCERGFWVLSRYDDIWAAVHDHARFSSAQGIVAGQKTFGQDEVPMMIMMDPPRHDELRRLVSGAFVPRLIRTMEESVRGIARELLDALEPGEVDLVPAYAGPLPVTVIAHMIGVPIEDREKFREWSDALVRTNPDEKDSTKRAVQGATALLSYFPPLIEERRKRPRNDLISTLVATEEDGGRLSDGEITGTCFLLLTAGNETTTNLISNFANLLGTRPDLRKQLADDPRLIAAATDEVLRLESPVQGLARTLTEDVTFGGKRLEAGQQALMLFASANRDEDKFADPDQFIMGRKEPTLAFGHGVHYCLGAHLARLECRVAFEELLARAPDLEVLDGARRVHSALVRGFEELPVDYQPVKTTVATEGAK